MKLLLISAGLGFTVLMSHDLIHHAFGVGYTQVKTDALKLSSYYFTNFVIFITYCILAGAVIFLKWISEINERKNEELITDLNQVNLELIEKNTEIGTQSAVLLEQREVLSSNQKKLMDAYEEIERHKNLLSKENENLTAELIDKNKDLTEANAELIKYNNELRQFSYTVSHNLRGPVASLLGLSGLIDMNQLDANNLEIINHLKTSVTQLDVIIHDLSKIIDIRHDIFKIRQKINLASEIEEIKEMLRKEIKTHHIHVTYDLDLCPVIYSVKPMVHSILYNLVSNSIKYRSLERPVSIHIKVHENDTYFIISITDNGLGINLIQHQENLFKLYKRFHYHTEGKGLGLYLVKLQCEALGGRIEVDSEVNKFTTFTVYLSKPENIQMQVLFDKPYAKIFYDAKMNATGVKWYGPITSEQYRKVFTKCFEFLIIYNTPNWVSDISEQGSILPEDQQWMFQNILQPAVQNGLKRIAVIRPDANHPDVIGYLNGIKATIAKLNVEQNYLMDFESACDWLIS